MGSLSRRKALLAIYARLRRRYGPGDWWPAETPFEVCLGAILVQNTSWTQAERALGALRERGLLSYAALAALSVPEIASLIRSSGTHTIKARRIRAFLDFLGHQYGGEVRGMARERTDILRSKLLSVNGIGPETADCMVLYAAGHPVFVVDAYTRRVFERLGFLQGDEDYGAVQRVFMGALPTKAALFNDYHAQVVTLAKDVCRVHPRCSACPLDPTCPKRGLGSRVGLSRRRSDALFHPIPPRTPRGPGFRR